MLAFLFLLFTSGAQASSQPLANALLDLVPEGYSEGVDQAGAPCRVIFGIMPDVDPNLVQYARIQVIPELGRIIDLQFFFDGYGGPVAGSASSAGLELRYRSLALKASPVEGGILLEATDARGSANCTI
jgi:hypothetical protein